MIDLSSSHHTEIQENCFYWEIKVFFFIKYNCTYYPVKTSVFWFSSF